MKYVLLLFVALFFTFDLIGQNRDTLVVKKLYFIQHDSTVVNKDSIWSNKFNNYIDYSRIDMGQRMNCGIKYSKKANKQFWMGIGCIALGGITYTYAAYCDPAVYVESHSKYTKDYYHDAIDKRNISIGVGSAFTIGGAYLLWRSHKNDKLARWFISPDGIKYKF